VDQLEFISVYSIFLKPVLDCAGTLLCSFCEAMARSLSVASNAVLSASVAVVDSVWFTGLQHIAGIIMALGHCLGVRPH
jgi:hypothetical protein